jgi:uncharacterized LabA/DUF88 family protein
MDIGVYSNSAMIVRKMNQPKNDQNKPEQQNKQRKPRFQFRRPKNQHQKQSPAKKPNYAFIDSQNLNLGVIRAGWKMDWKKFRAHLKDAYGVEKAYMFIGYVPDNESLYQQMHDAGYLVVLKPTVDMLMTEEELKDEKHVTKGNADAELVLYAMKELQHYDKAVIVSGDGDFYCIVEYLEAQGKLLHLLAPNDHYSSLYKPYEKFVLVVNNFRKELMYAMVPRRRHNKPKTKS